MKRKNKLLTLSLLFANSLVCLAGCGEDYSGEWYGVGIDVSLGSRTDFLVGEIVDPSMFSYSAYDEGEEVTVNPEDVTVEPKRSLTLNDKKLTFKWRKYTTTLDINVSDKLISECANLENGAFKYEEPVHDAVTSDGSIDTRKAKIDGAKDENGNAFSYLEEVSYGSNFSYSFNTENEGDELYVYASVASNNYIWGSVSEKYKSNICGTNPVPLSEVVTLSNNGTIYETKKTADIPSTIITEDDMDEHNDEYSGAWFTVLNLATKNFKRRWIGKISLEKGINNIKLDFNKKEVGGGSFAYRNLACGNWNNIELRYVKKGEDIKTGTLKLSSYPKQEYIVGEKFSLDGAYLYIENEAGLTNEIDMSKVEISNVNPLSPADKTIDLIYEGSKITLPITVTNKITSDFRSDDSPIKYIEPTHDRDSSNNVVEDATKIDTRAAKKSSTLKSEPFLENVSAYGKFKYSYQSSKSYGKFDIYASVASNGPIYGDISKVWPGAKNGFTGSKGIDFTKILTLKNNEKEFPINENAVIPETLLTSDMDLASIKQEENIKTSAWAACTYFALNNFKRIHLGTVDIVEGNNEIEINVGYQPGGFGYVSSMCGNWKDIEFIYIDESTSKTPTSIQAVTSPKTEYKLGETFTLDGAKFNAFNSDGVDLGTIDNDQIEILNGGKLFESKTINLKYKDVNFSIDVKVESKVTQEYTSLDVNSQSIKYIEMSTDTNKKANIVGKYMEKVSKDSYFEYEIDSDKERTVSIYAEVATNAYLNKTDEGYKDYDTGIEGFTQNYIGSYDLDLSKVVKMTNSVNDAEPVEYKVNEDAIAYGHVINAADDAEAAKTRFTDKNGKLNQWGMADELCTRNFRNIKLGEVKLSAGKNVIRLTMQGYLKKNSFAFEGYACGNWKSITIEMN